MRVLHVVASARRRGAEVFASDLISALGSDGVDHRVAVLHGDGGPAVRFGVPTAMVAGDGALLPGLRVAPAAVRGLTKLARSWRPDVVQAHGGEALKHLVLGGMHRRIPVVLRSLGAAPPWIQHGPRRAAHGFLMRQSARVVVVAEALRPEMVRTFGLSDDRVVTIPNAVDRRRLRSNRDPQETRSAFGVPPTHRVLLSLGALTWEKDPLAAVEVSARLADRGLPVTHLMAGDGPMRADVERAIGRRGLQSRLQVLGTRDDVPDLLSAEDVVLFASRSDGMEGMPAALIEAGMMARPVVAYSVAGVSEVVAHGETGLLAPSGNLDALIERAILLLEDDRMRREMGSAAERRCATRFDIGPVSRRYLSLYQSLAR